nr:MAG TPA: hypothetical protein [Crassvirales sp.]
MGGNRACYPSQFVIQIKLDYSHYLIRITSKLSSLNEDK